MPPETSAPPRGRPQSEAEVRPSGAAPRRRSDRERAWRRGVRIGLGISLVVHLLVLLLVSGTLPLLPGPVVEPPTPRPVEEGMVVIELAEPDEPEPEVPAEEPRPQPDEPAVEPAPELAEPPEPDEPVEEPTPEVEPVPVVPAPETPLPEEEPEDELSAAERLQPRMGDERLWIDFDRPVVTERLERYARADSALRDILGHWLDSLRLTEEQRRRARDWTIGEGDQRWGISEEGLHLGDIVIPIPFGQLFQETGPRGREAREALRELQEIRQQEARREVEDSMDERRDEMRQRSREESERRGSDTTSSGGR